MMIQFLFTTLQYSKQISDFATYDPSSIDESWTTALISLEPTNILQHADYRRNSFYCFGWYILRKVCVASKWKIVVLQYVLQACIKFLFSIVQVYRVGAALSVFFPFGTGIFTAKSNKSSIILKRSRYIASRIRGTGSAFYISSKFLRFFLWAPDAFRIPKAS